jgi:tripartite-type tricarboxylate transporter receptor subunit TctC
MPGAITFASSGSGLPQHLASEMFKRMVGIDILHIPFKGSGPAMVDLIGGQVQAQLLGQGAVSTFTTPEEAGKAIAAEYAKWAKVIKEGNIKPD